MSRNCCCEICGRPTDCSGKYCDLCLADNPTLEQEPNGKSCAVQLQLNRTVMDEMKYEGIDTFPLGVV